MPTPHFRVPFRLDGTRISTVVQDTETEITQSAAVVARYPRGVRTDLPDFGATDQTFQPRVDTGLLRVEVEEWEPRFTGDYQLDVDAMTQTVTVTRKDV